MWEVSFSDVSTLPVQVSWDFRSISAILKGSFRKSPFRKIRQKHVGRRLEGGGGGGGGAYSEQYSI